MIDTKRTIAGVRIFVDTQDAEKAEKVKQLLDEMHNSHRLRQTAVKFTSVVDQLHTMAQGAAGGLKP